jgi:chromosome transmission fidelity protein 18
VLDQEYQKNIKVRKTAARQSRYRTGNANDNAEFRIFDHKESGQNLTHTEDHTPAVKRDFFGRVLKGDLEPLGEVNGNTNQRKEGRKVKGKYDMKAWVSFHEGFSNAVRKPITVEEILKGL